MYSKPPKKVRKLFYNEYPYKIVVRVKNASFMRSWSIPQIIDWCQSGVSISPGNSSSLYKYAYWAKTPSAVDRENLLHFCTILSNFSNKNFKFRIERSTISIFLKDKDLYGSLALALDEFVTELWEPENADILSALLSNKKTIICNEYPYGIYKYKVTLGSSSKKNGSSLVEWIDRYPADKILLNQGSRKYLEENHPYYDPWVYVADEQMIMMLNFATSGGVRRCEEFVLKSSISTG
jgi:hypothetical protein